MKFVTFEALGTERLGLIHGDKVLDLNYLYAAYLKKEGEPTPLRIANAVVPPNILEFLDGEDRSLEAAKLAYQFAQENFEKLEGPNGERVVWKREDVRLKAPIPRPRLMVDFSTFESHVKMAFEKFGLEVPDEWYKVPVGYKMNPFSVIGPEDPILWPSYTNLLDYELEFGICIGKKCKNVRKDEAYDFVFGYTIVNDVSARDLEFLELKAMPLGPLKSKDFDGGTVMGPCIVTKDEIKDPHNLKMVARVNGEVWSEANTKDMYWKIPDLVEYLSKDQTLYPGTLILSGTPGGGCGLHLGKFLKLGDVVELEIEGIGVIRNKVLKN